MKNSQVVAAVMTACIVGFTLCMCVLIEDGSPDLAAKVTAVPLSFLALMGVVVAIDRRATRRKMASQRVK